MLLSSVLLNTRRKTSGVAAARIYTYLVGTVLGPADFPGLRRDTAAAGSSREKCVYRVYGLYFQITTG